MTRGAAAENLKKPFIVAVSKGKSLLILFCHLQKLFLATVTGLALALMFEDLLNLPNSLLGYLKGKDMKDRLYKLKKDLCPHNGF